MRKLDRHPSIVLWSACNECGGGKGDPTVYTLPIVTAEDQHRAVWPASPAHFGFKSGVSTLTGFPNGLPFQVGNATNGGLPVNESHASPWRLGPEKLFLGPEEDSVFGPTTQNTAERMSWPPGDNPAGRPNRAR